MVNQSNVGSDPIQGYFVILDEDEKERIEKSKKMESGRAGVFHKKGELIAVLQSNSALQKKNMHIVTITIPHHCITNANCKRFGIKNVHEITIEKIEPLETLLLKQT